MCDQKVSCIVYHSQVICWPVYVLRQLLPIGKHAMLLMVLIMIMMVSVGFILIGLMY